MSKDEAVSNARALVERVRAAVGTVETARSGHGVVLSSEDALRLCDLAASVPQARQESSEVMSNDRALVERVRALARGLRPHEAADLRRVCDLASSVITPPQGMQEAALSSEEIAEMEMAALVKAHEAFYAAWNGFGPGMAIDAAAKAAIAHIRASGQQGWIENAPTTPAEVSAAQARLNAVAACVVLGDPAKCVSFPTSHPQPSGEKI